MLKKTIKLFPILTALILVGYFLLNRPPELKAGEIPAKASIPYPSEFNYRQTINDCGPFNVAAVVRTLTGEEVDSAEFARQIKWRLPNKYTLPWGLEKQLKENGIQTHVPNVSRFSDEEKIAFLRQSLAENKPVILLGEREGYEHYLTLLGFDKEKDVFYVYDSFYEKGGEGLTVDDNGESPGNRDYSTKELLEFWRGGGMYGFYNWYIIITNIEPLEEVL